MILNKIISVSKYGLAWFLIMGLSACSTIDSGLTTSASMRIEVEVYKGPLSKEPEIQKDELIGFIEETEYSLRKWMDGLLLVGNYKYHLDTKNTDWEPRENKLKLETDFSRMRKRTLPRPATLVVTDVPGQEYYKLRWCEDENFILLYEFAGCTSVAQMFFEVQEMVDEIHDLRTQMTERYDLSLLSILYEAERVATILEKNPLIKKTAELEPFKTEVLDKITEVQGKLITSVRPVLALEVHLAELSNQSRDILDQLYELKNQAMQESVLDSPALSNIKNNILPLTNALLKGQPGSSSSLTRLNQDLIINLQSPNKLMNESLAHIAALKSDIQTEIEKARKESKKNTDTNESSQNTDQIEIKKPQKEHLIKITDMWVQNRNRILDLENLIKKSLEQSSHLKKSAINSLALIQSLSSQLGNIKQMVIKAPTIKDLDEKEEFAVSLKKYVEKAWQTGADLRLAAVPGEMSRQDLTRTLSKASRIAKRLSSKGLYWAFSNVSGPFKGRPHRAALVNTANLASQHANQISARADSLLKQLKGIDRQSLPLSIYLRDTMPTDFLNLYVWFRATGPANYVDMFFHPLDSFSSEETSDRMRVIERLFADNNWAKINTAYASGQGKVNMAFVKDDIGNWNLKSFDNDPTELVKAYANITRSALEKAKDIATSGATGGATDALKMLQFSNQNLTGRSGVGSPSFTPEHIQRLHDITANKLKVLSNKSQSLEDDSSKSSDLLAKQNELRNEAKQTLTHYQGIIQALQETLIATKQN